MQIQLPAASASTVLAVIHSEGQSSSDLGEAGPARCLQLEAHGRRSRLAPFHPTSPLPSPHIPSSLLRPQSRRPMLSPRWVARGAVMLVCVAAGFLMVRFAMPAVFESAASAEDTDPRHWLDVRSRAKAELETAQRAIKKLCDEADSDVVAQLRSKVVELERRDLANRDRDTDAVRDTNAATVSELRSKVALLEAEKRELGEAKAKLETAIQERAAPPPSPPPRAAAAKVDGRDSSWLRRHALLAAVDKLPAALLSKRPEITAYMAKDWYPSRNYTFPSLGHKIKLPSVESPCGPTNKFVDPHTLAGLLEQAGFLVGTKMAVQIGGGKVGSSLDSTHKLILNGWYAKPSRFLHVCVYKTDRQTDRQTHTHTHSLFLSLSLSVTQKNTSKARVDR
jgi:hypothetical protein